MSALGDHPDVRRRELDCLPGLGEFTEIARGEDAHQVPWIVGVDHLARRVVFEHGADASFLTFDGGYAVARALIEAASQVEWAEEDAT